MKNRTKITIIGVLVVAAITITAVYANADRLVNWQIQNSVKENIAAQAIDPDAFEIVLCGTGSPQYQPDRGQPCTAIIAAEQVFLFDSGQGASQGMQASGVPILKLHRVFLTHLHSDHISGLGDVLHNSWLYGRKQEAVVIGPPGTAGMLEGVQMSFAADMSERNKMIGNEYGESNSGMGTAQEAEVEGDTLTLVYDQNGVKISAFRVDHPAWENAYGYKFEYQGKVIVISGDTRRSANLVRHAVGADILIHEVLNTSMMRSIAEGLREHGDATVDPERMETIISTHTSTTDLAELATEANVGTLVLTHLIPPIPASSFVEGAFTQGMTDIFDGELIVARDGLRIDLSDD
ncbi:MAG: MBL fold metallo-hydrolase [Erythrobacter sp.]